MFGIIYGNIQYAMEAFIKCLMCIVPFIIVEVFLARKNNLTISKGHIIGELIFVYLIVFMLEFTTISSLARILYLGIEIHPETFNFIPFSTITIDALPYLTNIILFIPFGFLCPALWENQRTIKKIVLAGFLFSLIIETSQIFNMRVTDVDDLLMNTLGASLGYLIFKIIEKTSIASIIKNYLVLGNHFKLPFILRHEMWFLIGIVFGFEFLFLVYLPLWY